MNSHNGIYRRKGGETANLQLCSIYAGAPVFGPMKLFVNLNYLGRLNKLP